MSDSLDALAKKAEELPFFLAQVLASYAGSEDLDDEGLSAALGCRVEDLAMLRLCRAPRMEAGLFWDDVTRVADHFKIDPYTLASIVKRGRVVARLQEEPAAQESGFLMAARDREETPPKEQTP